MSEKGYFDNVLEAQVARNREILLEFLEEVRREGRRLAVFHRPSLESTVATGILVSSLEASGIRVVARPSLAPSETGLPTIYIDIEPPERGKELYIGSRLKGRRKNGYIYSSNGLASLTALMLEGIAPLNRYSQLAAIASAYAYDRDTGEKRDLVGLDKEAAIKADSMKASFTLLIYRAEREPLASSLARTVIPYYPGVTGKEEEARKLLEESSVDPDAIYGWISEKKVEELSAVIQLLADLVSKRYVRRPRNPRGIIAGITYFYLGQAVLWDLRELAVVLEASHYAWGPGIPLLYTTTGSERRIYRSYLSHLLPRIVSLVEDARNKPGILDEIRIAGKKVWVHREAGPGDPLSIAARALRLLGVVENRPIIAGSPPSIPLDEAIRTGIWPLPSECISGYRGRGSWIMLGEDCLEDQGARRDKG